MGAVCTEVLILFLVPCSGISHHDILFSSVLIQIKLQRGIIRKADCSHTDLVVKDLQTINDISDHGFHTFKPFVPDASRLVKNK